MHGKDCDEYKRKLELHGIKAMANIAPCATLYGGAKHGYHLSCLYGLCMVICRLVEVDEGMPTGLPCNVMCARFALNLFVDLGEQPLRMGTAYSN